MKALKDNIVLKVLSLNSFSVAISFVLGIFSSKIIAVYLGSSGMALMGSFRNFASMIKSLATLGISNAVIKLFVENKEDKESLSIIYSTFFWLFLGLSSFLGLLVCVLATPIADFLFFNEAYTIPVRFFGLMLPLMVINTFWLAIYNSFEMYKRIVLIQIISNILIFGVTALLIYKKLIFGGLLSVVIGEVIMVMVTFLFVRSEDNYFRFDLQRVVQKKHLKVVSQFSVMALLSAVLIPITLIFIRDELVKNYSVNEAGIWDAVNRLSGFYMMFFSSGLTLYYMPKLASIHTESAFKMELKAYFKILVPIFFFILTVIFLGKQFLLELAFTKEFYVINDFLIWQLAGDFIKIITLAFGFQILVKTMIKRYFAVELVFNLTYILLALFMMQSEGATGAVKAYFYANVIGLLFVLFLFRRLFFKAKSI